MPYRGCALLERAQVLKMEPNTNPEGLCALYAPTSGLVSPHELTFALADHAAVNGVAFRMGEEVTGLGYDAAAERWHVLAGPDEHTCRILVNCAGTGAAHLHNLIGSDPKQIIYRRGEYYLMDRMDPPPFSSTMFQCPTAMGKGVLVSPTVHGNILLGPSAEDIPDERDVANTAESLAAVLQKARLTWPNLAVRQNITNFSGVRAHEADGDFIVGGVLGAVNAYEAIGIESPGLSSAPAIAEMLGEQIAREQGLVKKHAFVPAPVRPKPFSAMNDRERSEAVTRDPLYGRIVCRCETVTEAEIRAAIRRPVGARTLDGVKRRTRAGMGRCQGGFCSPRVLAILAEELGVSPTEVTKCGGSSRLLISTLRESMTGGRN